MIEYIISLIVIGIVTIAALTFMYILIVRMEKEYEQIFKLQEIELARLRDLYFGFTEDDDDTD